MKTLKQFLLSILLCWGCFSCGSDKDFSMVPKDASFLAVVDFKNLALNTLSLKRLLESAEDTSGTIKIRKKIGKLGLDFFGKGYIFQRGAAQAKNHFYCILPLDSPEDFLSFLKETDSNAVATRGTDLNWVRGDNYFFCIKGQYAVGMLGTRVQMDKVNQEYISQLFDLPEDDRLDETNPRVSKMKEDGFDACFWMDLNKLVNLSEYRYLAMAQNSSGEVMASLRFKDGKIAVDGTGFFGDPEMKKLSQFYQKNLDPEFLKYVSRTKPCAFVAFRLALPEILKSLGTMPFMPLVDQQIEANGFRKEDIMAFFTGQMAVSMLSMPRNIEKNPVPTFLFVGEVGDRDRILRVISQLIALGILKREVDHTYSLPSYPGIRVNYRNNVLDISNSPIEGRQFFSMESVPDLKPGFLMYVINFDELTKDLPKKDTYSPFHTFSNFWTSSSGYAFWENEETQVYSLQVNSNRKEENTLLTSSDFIWVMGKEIQHSKILPKLRAGGAGIINEEPYYTLPEDSGIVRQKMNTIKNPEPITDSTPYPYP